MYMHQIRLFIAKSDVFTLFGVVKTIVFFKTISASLKKNIQKNV